MPFPDVSSGHAGLTRYQDKADNGCLFGIMPEISELAVLYFEMAT